MTILEHDFDVPTVEEWEDKVFLSAYRSGHFNVFRKTGFMCRETERFHDFAEAAMNAYNDPRALVYAVTKTERAVCLPRKRWLHYLELIKQEVNNVTSKQPRST